MIGIVIPLGAYEGQFGIILLASALIAFLTPKDTYQTQIDHSSGVYFRLDYHFSFGVFVSNQNF